MSRTARKKSSTNCYHIMLRGVNRSEIFFDDQDRRYFLKLLKHYAEKTNTLILTYCLMHNHVHLLLQTETPGDLIKRITSGYVYYINHKYDRVGHLFQARFKSEPVEDEQYLLTVFRYILKNPQKAGICTVDKYRWSGYPEIGAEKGICDTRLIVSIAGGTEALLQFIKTENNDECLEWDEPTRWTDQTAADFVNQTAGITNPILLRTLPKDFRNYCVHVSNQAGISIERLARITDLSKSTIYNILHSKK